MNKNYIHHYTFSSSFSNVAILNYRSVYTGCPKSTLTTLNQNNLKIKICIAKPNYIVTYLNTRGLHNYFDTKYDVRTGFTSDL